MHVGLFWLGAAVLLAAGEAAGGELFMLMVPRGAPRGSGPPVPGGKGETGR